MFGKNKPKTIKDFNDEDTVSLTTDPFYTIQGEGIYLGHPAIFIRYSGCNLTCGFCDTDFENRQDINVDRLVSNVIDMLSEINSSQDQRQICNLVVITGGEPFIHASLNKLTTRLCEKCINVQIETAGTIYQKLDRNSDIDIVCSPKTYIHPKFDKLITAYKFVVSTKTANVDKNLGLPTSIIQGTMNVELKPKILEYIKPRHSKQIYISPMDEYDEQLNKDNLKLVGQICMKYGYIANIQLHKHLELD